MTLLWTKVVSLVGNVGTNETLLNSAVANLGLIEHVTVRTVTPHAGGTLRVALMAVSGEADGSEQYVKLYPASPLSAGGTLFGGKLFAERGVYLLDSGNAWENGVGLPSGEIYLKTVVASSNITAGSVRVSIFGHPFGYVP